MHFSVKKYEPENDSEMTAYIWSHDTVLMHKNEGKHK